jgi:O-antigen ligase
MRLHLVGAAYALWLFAIELVFYWSHGPDTSALQVVAILGLLPMALQLFFLGINPFGLVLPTRMALFFVLIALLSFLANGANSAAITYTIELLFLFTVAIVVGGCPDARLIPTIAIIASVPNAVFLLDVVFTGRYIYGRLIAGGVEPNWWGLMGVWLALSAVAFRSRLLTGGCVAVGYLTMYYASARGSLLAASVALIVLAMISLRRLRGMQVYAAMGVVAVLALSVVVLDPHLNWSAVSNFAGDVMKIDDPNRGLGQGFTGRSNLWDESIALWESSPLFGVGFRQHDWYLSEHLNAHNAYLAMLADTGVAGLVWYVSFIGLSLAAALRLPNSRGRDTIVATIVGYAVVGLFERRAVNGGNPFSIYFILCCVSALAQRQWLAALGAKLPRRGRSLRMLTPEEAAGLPAE